MSETSGSTFAILHAIANTGDITGYRMEQVARNVIEITDEMNGELTTLRKENEELKAELGVSQGHLEVEAEYSDTLKARIAELEETVRNYRDEDLKLKALYDITKERDEARAERDKKEAEYLKVHRFYISEKDRATKAMAVVDAAWEATKMWDLMMRPDTPQSAMDADVAYANLRARLTALDRGKS